MADRVIVYDGALPQTQDVLYTNMFAMVSEAFQNFAMIGTTASVAGLACTPTSPASLSVNIGTGCIFQVDPTDSAAYGDLGTNTASLIKMGILPTALNFAITPPGTVGFSQVFLFEAILQDIDAGSLVLSYYNSANPAQPFSGPANSGASQFTQRTCRCTILMKAGVAATTGTQVTPSTDAGYVPLFAVTVAQGQATITSGNIAQVATAPFFPTLPQVPVQVQGGTYVYAGVDTGAANAYVITFAPGQPIPTAYTAGMGIKFKALNSCTGTSTINVNGLGAVTIHRASGAGLATGDIVSGGIVELTYDGTFFQMQNYLGSGTNTNTNTLSNIPYVADSGTQNQLIGTYSPVITSGQQVAGLALAIKLANSITGACTINVNGLGAKNVTLGDATNPPFNVFTAGMVLLLEYDGTEYQIVNTSAGMFYRKPTSNYSIFVNTSTGSDTLYDGTSATVTGIGTAGPFKTISKGVLQAWSFAPSAFNITIQVANGTYNEAVSTPSYAGPNVTINGASMAGVVINSGTSTCISVSGANTLTVQNLTVQNSGPTGGAGCFLSTGGATLFTNNTQSNACGGGIFNASGGSLNVGNHTFNSSCYAFYFAASNGQISLGNSVSQVISTSIAVTIATAYADLGGTIAVGISSPAVFSNPGFVSGAKFLCAYNGTINTTGQGASYFPGTVGGSTITGGQIAT